MIDSLVMMLEKVVEFARERKDRERRAFESLVKPMFDGLKTAHDDYLKLFNRCSERLKTDDPLAVILAHISEERLNNEALRRSLVVFAQSYVKDQALARYHLFFQSVIYYLGYLEESYGEEPEIYDAKIWSGWGRIRRSSHSSSLVVELADLIASEDEIQRYEKMGVGARHAIFRTTLAHLESLRKKWDIVCSEYAKLIGATL